MAKLLNLPAAFPASGPPARIAPSCVLLFCAGPSAVARLVMPVVVESVYGVAFRTIAHVGKEVGEYQPAVAHRYAPTAIGRIASVPFVKAARQHPGPATGRTRMIAEKLGLLASSGAQLGCDQGFGFLGVSLAGESGIVISELSGIAKCVLSAFASFRARPFVSAVLVSLTGASGFAFFRAMASTCAIRCAFASRILHEVSIAYLLTRGDGDN